MQSSIFHLSVHFCLFLWTFDNFIKILKSKGQLLIQFLSFVCYDLYRRTLFYRAMSTQNYLVNQSNYDFLKTLGLKERNAGCFSDEWSGSGEVSKIISPINKSIIAEVQTASLQDYDKAAQAAKNAHQVWRNIPAPQRGEIVR